MPSSIEPPCPPWPTAPVRRPAPVRPREHGWRALAAVLLLGGCSHWPAPEPEPRRDAAAPTAAPAASAPVPPPVVTRPEPPPAPPQPADAAARRLLAFHDRLRELPPAELAREQSRLDAARQGADPGDADASAGLALELALVLAQTRQNGDLARALGLVEPLTRAAAPARWQPLARLLHARLLEQRRLEEQADRQAQQLREQQRRLDQLSSQLEALKAIERSLNTRAPPAAGAASTPPGPAATPAPARTP